MTWATKESFRYGQVDKRVLANETSDPSIAGLEIHQNAICTQAGTSLKRPGSALTGQPVVTTATSRWFFFRIAGVGDFTIEATNLKFRFWKDGTLVPSYSLTTTYTTANLPNMHVEQTAGSFVITCPGKMPQVLTRAADNNWSIAEIDNTYGPWLTYREQGDSMSLIAQYLFAGFWAAVISSADIFVDAAGPTGDRSALLFINDGWVKLSDTSAHFNADGTIVYFCTILSTVPTTRDATFEWQGPYREAGANTAVNITVAALNTTFNPGDPVSLTGSGAVFTAGTHEGYVMDIDSGGTARSRYVIIDSIISTTLAYGRIIGGTITATTYTNSQFLAPSSPANTIYLTWNESAGTLTTTGGDYFQSAHADGSGALFYYRGGVLRVTAYNSATSVDVDMVIRPTGTGPSAFWRESLWNDVQGYPVAVTKHQDRLVLGGATGAPHTFNLSKPGARDEGNYQDFDIGESAVNDALDFDLDPGTQINWLVSSGNLVIGTDMGEYAVSAQGVALTPSDSFSIPQSTVGGANIQARRFGRFVVFVGRDSVKLYSLQYSEIEQRNVPTELSRLSTDLFAESPIEYIDMVRSPYPMILCLRADGTVIALTYEPDAGILSPSKWSTGDSIESLVVVPGSAGDEIWMTVKRGSSYYHEVIDFTRHFDHSEIATPSAGVVSGLTIANGTAVRVWDIDAELDLGAYTVASGGLTLNNGYQPSGNVEVGIAVSYRLKGFIPVMQDQRGLSTGRKMKMGGAHLYVIESNGGTINGVTIPFRQSDPYTGEVRCAPLHSVSDSDRPSVDIIHAVGGKFEVARITCEESAHG